MTPQDRIDQAMHDTREHLQQLRDANQPEHAEWLRREMWRILGPFARARISGAA